MTRTRLILLGLGLVMAVTLITKLALFLDDIFHPYRLPYSDWRLYQRNFISADGRVIDTGNKNISHSEGQGYGLLIAVAYNDRRTFDRIWTWTQKNLQTRSDDKLLSWEWKPDGQGGGAVSDPNNASDGDLLVAWALIRAKKQWNDFAYEKAAAQILVDLARLDVKEGDGGPFLLPGTVGFFDDPAITLNPSYYIFPALAELAAAFPGTPWTAVSEAGSAMIEKARFGKWNLPPDWVSFDHGTYALSSKFPPEFGYNAVRVPLHLAWQNPQSPFLAPFASFWKSFAPDKIPATVNLQDDSFGPNPALPGMRAIAAFTLACAEKRNLTVRAIPVLTKGDSYFSASLSLLTKIAVRDRFAKK